MRFQFIAVAAMALWLVSVALWHRKSAPVLLGGLGAVAGCALAAGFAGEISWDALGLRADVPIPVTFAWALGWLAPMLALSPAADWIATRLFAAPPDLGAFRAIQESWIKLLAGILFAWVAGGLLEELALRGVFLGAIKDIAALGVGPVAATATGVIAAACAACVIHLYQGPRAALIVAQLSVLFGVLYLLSGRNLLAVMLCHGLYDTIAFTRFAMRKSKYSDL